jgi:CheY-like chemotaxis protein
MDGIQAVEQILAQHEIPVIFMSGYADAETIARANQLNPVAFLEKPVFPQQLAAAIEAAIKLIT